MILNKINEIWWRAKESEFRWALEWHSWKDQEVKNKVRVLYDELVGLKDNIVSMGYNETVQAMRRLEAIIYEADKLIKEYSN